MSASYKHLFSRALSAAPARLHFAAHSHHLWPDASYEGHVAAWDDAARLADRKWDKIFGEVIPTAQKHVADELRLPDPSTIAFAPSTHDFLLRLFSAKFDHKRPLEVLTTDGEFHAFRRQSERWEEAGWIKRRMVACEPFDTFTARFVEAAQQAPADIIFLSHVMFRSGLRFDGAGALADLARPEGPWVVLDGYHAFMALPVDLARVADRVFYVGGGYKYAMAGEGAAYLHCPPGYAARPADTGWFADFVAIEAKQQGVAYARDGGRFLGSTYDATGLYRFNAVRSMLDDAKLDTAAIAARLAPLRARVEHAIEAGECGPLDQAEILRPNADGPQARFISLRHKHATAWKATLMRHDIITDARDDVLRIGFGLYHDPDDIDPFCDAVKRALST
ncbi:MAG: class V aminotransferase [Hyphomonadaceae bacterium]